MPAFFAVALTLVAGFYFLRKEEAAPPGLVPVGTNESMK